MSKREDSRDIFELLSDWESVPIQAMKVSGRVAPRIGKSREPSLPNVRSEQPIRLAKKNHKQRLMRLTINDEQVGKLCRNHKECLQEGVNLGYLYVDKNWNEYECVLPTDYWDIDQIEI